VPPLPYTRVFVTLFVRHSPSRRLSLLSTLVIFGSAPLSELTCSPFFFSLSRAFLTPLLGLRFFFVSTPFKSFVPPCFSSFAIFFGPFSFWEDSTTCLSVLLAAPPSKDFELLSSFGDSTFLLSRTPFLILPSFSLSPRVYPQLTRLQSPFLGYGIRLSPSSLFATRAASRIRQIDDAIVRRPRVF